MDEEAGDCKYADWSFSGDFNKSFSSQIGYSMDGANAKEYYEQGDYVEAYTCFTQGAKVKAGANAEYENMLAELEQLLSENYSMTLDQARELYDIHEKDDYTYTHIYHQGARVFRIIGRAEKNTFDFRA